MSGVGHQVHNHLMDLPGIHFYGRQVSSELSLKPDARRQGCTHQLQRFFNYGMQLHHLFFLFLRPAERQDVFHKFACPGARFQNFRQALPGGVLRRNIGHRQLRVAIDGQENVVEVVGDAAGERSQRFQFLRTRLKFFRVPPRSDVRIYLENADRRALRVAVDHPLTGHVDGTAVARAVVQFSFPNPGGSQQLIDHPQRSGELRLQKFMRIAPQRFFFGVAVNLLRPAAPQHDAAVQVTHHHRGQVQQACLLLQFLFRFLLYRDVAQNYGEHFLTAEFHVRNGGLHGKFVAVSSQPKNSFPLPHLSPGDFRLPKLADMVLVRSAVTRRNKLVHGAPDRFGFCVPKNLFRRGIEQNDVLVFIHCDHPAQSRMNDRGEPRFSFLNQLLRLMANRYVLQNPVPEHAAVRLPLGHGPPLDPDFPALRVIYAKFTRPCRQVLRRILNRCPNFSHVLRVNHFEDPQSIPAELFKGNGENLLDRGVAIRKITGPVRPLQKRTDRAGRGFRYLRQLLLQRDAILQRDFFFALRPAIPKHEHHSQNVSLGVANRRPTVGDGQLRAIFVHQQCVVGQPDHRAKFEHFFRRIFHRFARILIPDLEYGCQGLPHRLLAHPSRQPLRFRIHERDPAYGVGRDHSIADACQCHRKLLAALP